MNTKFLLGNLAFSTSEQALSDFLIKRQSCKGPNYYSWHTSLGYDGRQINVEVAKPKAEGAAPAPRRGREDGGAVVEEEDVVGAVDEEEAVGWYGRRRFAARDTGGDTKLIDNTAVTTAETPICKWNGKMIRPKRRGGWFFVAADVVGGDVAGVRGFPRRRPNHIQNW
ncbi:unnamed protein product [Rhizophagus irregularis]|nr:unnamed protein product [Rhizophagus irregularis]